jgi:hypothetical protein
VAALWQRAEVPGDGFSSFLLCLCVFFFSSIFVSLYLLQFLTVVVWLLTMGEEEDWRWFVEVVVYMVIGCWVAVLSFLFLYFSIFFSSSFFSVLALFLSFFLVFLLCFSF